MTELDIARLHREIDETVWRPFKAAFEARDGAALNALYAEEVLRATPDGIDTDNQFKTQNLVPPKNPEMTVRLAFWLESRRTNATTSY